MPKGALIRQAVLGLVLSTVVPVLGTACATESGGKKRVVQTRKTGGPRPRSTAPVAKRASDPLSRERELISILTSSKVRKLPPEEQALAGALAWREITDLRAKRNDILGAREAIEKSVTAARASGDHKFTQQMLRDRFAVYRAQAYAAVDKKDFVNGLRLLDAMGLFSENTPEQRQQLASDRFIINDQRTTHIEANSDKSLAVPGEESVDTQAVLAEVDRVFGPMSSFASGPPEENFLERLGFELNASAGVDAISTLEIVSLPSSAVASADAALPSSRTRGHELAANDRITVNIQSGRIDGNRNGMLDAKSEAEVIMPTGNGGPLVETGRFDPRTVAALVSLNKRSVGRCYDRSLRAGERLTGKMEVRITVQPTGVVSLAEVATSQHATSELGRCVQQTMARWRFPPFNGAETQVTIPFFLKGAF